MNMNDDPNDVVVEQSTETPADPTSTATPTVDAPQSTKVPFKNLPLDEQNRMRREWLAKARAKLAAKRASGEVPPPKPCRPSPSQHRSPSDPTSTAQLAKEQPAVRNAISTLNQWTEHDWSTQPIEVAKARLALLKTEWETGARLVGQRDDSNNPATYRCFVCDKAVPERNDNGRPGWVSKQDYLNTRTGLYESAVICSAYCHTVYCNDSRLQRKMKDLLAGTGAATGTETQP